MGFKKLFWQKKFEFFFISGVVKLITVQKIVVFKPINFDLKLLNVKAGK